MKDKTENQFSKIQSLNSINSCYVNYDIQWADDKKKVVPSSPFKDKQVLS